MRRQAIWKEIGQTPLERIELFRQESQISNDIPLSYAGRLDPMASGKLLVLVGDECKKQKQYTKLDKEYEVEVLLGASTDTGDLLGIIHEIGDVKKEVNYEQVEQVLQKLIGKHEWEYPIFSSRTVKGKPLFQWYYEGRIAEIIIPHTDTNIHFAKLDSVHNITGKELLATIEERIGKITHVTEESKKLGQDFRRVEVLKKWNSEIVSDAKFIILKITVVCSSGSYMRTLAEKVGDALGVPACAHSIHRTRIGKYHEIGPLHFWFPSY